MRETGGVIFALALALSLCGGVARGQGARRPSAEARSRLDGVYRINIAQSDRLYTVVAGASSNLPFGEQQRFFIDLAVRLAPPDLLAIERRGARVTLGSSRAPHVTLVADGAVRTERAGDGQLVRTRVALEGERLVFTSSGRTADDFSVVFTPFDAGRRLRVTRRLSAEQLNEPVVIQTVYDKISDEPRWDIYGETLLAERAAAADDDAGAAETTERSSPPPAPRRASAARRDSGASGEAHALRAALTRWVAATNARDIERQMAFYAARLEAFYLSRNAPRAAVRAEKARVFAGAALVDIRAEEPEIVFRDAGATAVMRFRKKYRIEDGPRSRRGEVVQELRWRRTAGGWRIFSERDVRVIR